MIGQGHASRRADGTMAHVQDFLTALPTLRHGVKEASDLLERLHLYPARGGVLSARLGTGVSATPNGQGGQDESSWA